MAASTITVASPPPQATPLACAELVRQAQAGDRAAFEVLVHRHFDAVYAAAWARLANREAAEDLAQEVFLRAWLNLATLRSAEAFEPWLLRMARHLSITWRRNSRRRSELVPMVAGPKNDDEGRRPEEEPVNQAPDQSPSPRDAASATEERERLSAALAKLPAADRELVIRHFLDEHSQRDIARDTGEHHTTIGRRLATALGRLKALVGTRPTPEPVALVGARAGAAGRACAVVAALALMPPAAQAAVQAKAAASSATLIGSLISSAALAAEGIVAMGAASKLAVAATVAAVMIGGGTYVYQNTGAPSASAAVASANVTPTRTEPVVIGRDYVTTIRPGEVLRVDMTNMPGDFAQQYNDFYIGTDGRLMVRTIRDGNVLEEVPLYPITTDEALQNFTTFQVWPERNLCLAAVANGRPAPDGNGFEIALYTNNRPELLPQAEAIGKLYFEGKIPKRDAARRTFEFFAANGMLPTDERNRAQLQTLIQREWQ